MSKSKDSILVIGKPNSGKSGFFGQLYTRLQFQEEGTVAKLYKTPENVTALDKITECYAEGKALEHTPSSEYSEMDLPIEIECKRFILEYPDYGGEQINHLIYTRRLNDKWHEAICNSNNWLLFIRLNDIEKSYDPIQKFTEIVQSGDQREKVSLESNKVPSDQAYYIELLQILLFFKRIGFLQKIQSPKLTVILSCWDESDKVQDKKPAETLKEQLPLFYQFIQQNWFLSALNIIGLSSQGKPLDKEKADSNYLDVEEGYLIMPDGSSTKDLTTIFNLIGDVK